MDNLLAELYGTNDIEEEDFEKVAHLDFLEKVADEEGIDLNELSDDELEELAEIAAEAMEEDDDYEDEYYEEDFEKEAAAKVEEADFLGRVMAHSFNQELDYIEKDAGAYEAVRSGGREAYRRGARAAKEIKWGGLGDAVAMGPQRRAARKMMEPSTWRGRAAKRVDSAVRGLGRRLGAESTGRAVSRSAADTGRAYGKTLSSGGRGVREGWRSGRTATRWGEGQKGLKGFGKRRAWRALGGQTGAKLRGAADRGAEELARAHINTVRTASRGPANVRRALRSQRRRGYGAAAGAAGLAAGGAAGGAALYNREKNSADAEWAEAVEARAYEHLMAAGLADEYGNVYEPDFDKTAADDIEYEIDAAALEMLEAEGYPVTWY